MIRLRIEEILNEKEKSLYWLCRQMKMNNQSFQNLIQNRTLSIRYRTLERLCRSLDCRPGELFVLKKDEPTTSRQAIPADECAPKS